MKTTMFTISSMLMLTLTYAQGTKGEKFKIINAGKMKTSSHRTEIVLIDHVVLSVPNKLDIEADRILLDRTKNLLTAYGTKSFAFSGKIVVGAKSNGTCRYRLGDDTLRIGF
ncbi:MAG TPA: hypothetical protein VL728_04395 [Cyclobacteriaceae bacterium]|jgi:hypothetical protein|nr:hypothetical protein [Cyclobacteriaceae bacterium]